eukprot:388270-Pleurochrysis_carterae.AAC.1
MLRRPSRRCLLRRGALRRALEAISAWLHVAIGADISVERDGGRNGVVVVATFTRVGCKARRRHAPSMEGMAIAKSTVASLNCLSTSSMNRAAPKNSSGADTRN